MRLLEPGRMGGGSIISMSEKMTIELSESQRQILLRGLRYVRNAVMLEIREPTPDNVADRRDQLEEASALLDRLESC